ncbi:putative sugar phosphate/phosphate translocator At1g12500 [Psilocybe cubensis]|uniref:Sugar phosphate transporter domain-containing protein n=2 Tax=Psilocybe cubensis TaxID=181762 RepID=A0A8H8CHJ2_PSICU|nr:putative sugar phosphate/phosphate translocator At1g12500 [Psilocybe cubensis]KAH9474627.1 putative sugar phosphate/phosphate translocator At1g12500 [Psilocybe cubensis]
MSTPLVTPSIVLTSVANPAVSASSSSSRHEDLENVYLVASTDAPKFANQEPSLNGSIRPRAHPGDVGPSPFGSAGSFGKEDALSQYASFEGGPGPTAKVRRKYHTDELSPSAFPSTEDLLLSSRSPADSESNMYEYEYDKESLLRGGSAAQPNAPSSSKIRVQLSRHASPILKATRAVIPTRIPIPIPARLRAVSDSPLLWLFLYFFLNLSLTLYNKTVLIHFPFPYTLTALHAFCGTIGTRVLLRVNSAPAQSSYSHSHLTGARMTSAAQPQSTPVPNLNGREYIVLLLFSTLYTINIVVSNASLRLVTVPFHQVVRASTPFFTIMFAAALLGKRSSRRKLLSLVPVVIGVGFATYGDYYFTPFGFFLTLLGTVLASLKTILTNVILVKPSSSGLPIATSTSASTSPVDSAHAVHDEKRAQAPSLISSVSSNLVKRVFPQSTTSTSTIMSNGDGNNNSIHSNTTPTTPAPLTYAVKMHSSTTTTTTSSSGTGIAHARALPKLSLSPIHLLYLLSPLAFVQTTLLAHFTGELERVRWHLFDPALTVGSGMGGTGMPGGMGMGMGGKVHVNGRVWLILNGVLAFLLNVVSFNANKRVGALGMSVAANVKQVLTVLSAVVLFDLTITPANGLGILLTLIGGALYAAVELKEKREGSLKSRIG